MIKINLEKCEFQFEDFVLSRNTSVAEILQRDDIFDINPIRYQRNVERYNGVQNNVLARLKENVSNNNITASVLVSVDERQPDRKSMSITITLHNAKTNEELIQLNKDFLQGIVIGEYKETEQSIVGGYDWGYMCSQLRTDRDCGVVGGEINIRIDS